LLSAKSIAKDVDGNNVAFVMPMRHAGQYFDSEVGLFYNSFRDYDPATGRYVESDPIGLQGGMNTYGYVGGSPVIVSDALGLSESCRFMLNPDGSSYYICDSGSPKTGCVTPECAAQVQPVPEPSSPATKCTVKCNLLGGLPCGFFLKNGNYKAFATCRAGVAAACRKKCKPDQCEQ
jgi:RHS repeat-associated protein